MINKNLSSKSPINVADELRIAVLDQIREGVRKFNEEQKKRGSEVRAVAPTTVSITPIAAPTK